MAQEDSLEAAKVATLLDDSQSYLDLQAQLSQELRAAFFALAEARYALGAGKIGQAQYPAAMQASQRVAAAAEDGRTNFRLQQPGPETQRVSQQSNSSQGEFSGVLASLAEQFQCQSPQTESVTDSLKAEQRQEPLRWFGVMVPAALRQAQKRFAAALEQCVALSGQRAAVLAALSEFRATQPNMSEVASNTVV